MKIKKVIVKIYFHHIGPNQLKIYISQLSVILVNFSQIRHLNLGFTICF